MKVRRLSAAITFCLLTFASIGSAQENANDTRGHVGRSRQARSPSVNWEYFNEFGRYHLDGNATTGSMTLTEREGGTWKVRGNEPLHYVGRVEIPAFGEEGFEYEMVNETTVHYLFIFNREVVAPTADKPGQYRIWRKVGAGEWIRYKYATGVTYP